MKKTFGLSRKKKLLITFTILTLASATLVASLPAVLAIGNNPVGNTVELLQSILTSIMTTENNLNKVKIEQVIEGTVDVTTSYEIITVSLNCSQTWDLMAIYISTQNVSYTGPPVFTEVVLFKNFSIGTRHISPPDIQQIDVARGSDADDFPIFPSDMTENGQSIIAVPANATFTATGIGIAEFQETSPNFGLSVFFKIVIQRPIDPDFACNVSFSTTPL